MNKYICVRELIFRLFRDVSLGRLYSNSLIARATTPQHPGVVRLHVKAFYFPTTAGGLPHLPGIPHLHVNRPIVSQQLLTYPSPSPTTVKFEQVKGNANQIMISICLFHCFQS